MFEGITVLSQTELYDASMALVMIPAIIALFGFLFLGVWLGANRDAVVVVSVMLAFVVALISYNANKYPTGEYEYECVIEESVSTTEFCERYEIVGQRGKIYIIKEKSDD